MRVLDADVLSIVFSFLATPSELATLSLVSHNFYTLANANHLWEQILQQNKNELEEFESNQAIAATDSSPKKRYQHFIEHSYYQWERKEREEVDGQAATRIVKLLMVGDSGAGKTSFVHRYQEKEFYQYRPTIGVDFQISMMQHRRTKEVIKIQMWDTAGPERYRTISRAYYRGAHGIPFIVDLSDDYSLETAQDKYDEIQQSITNDVVVLMIGSKVDLERRISYEEAKKFADERGMIYIETSAKTGQNVERAVRMLVHKIAQIIPPPVQQPQQPQQPQSTKSYCLLQ